MGNWHPDIREIVIQSLGFISFALFMIGYQVKDTRKTQLWFAPGNWLYGLQYFLLGSISASLIMTAAGMRDIVGAKGSDKALKIASVMYLVFIWAVIAVSAKSWQEGLMALSGTVSTIAVQFRSDFYRFRCLLMLRQVIMIAFNTWIKSYGGMIHLCFTLLSNMYGTWRHYKRPRKSDGSYVDE